MLSVCGYNRGRALSYWLCFTHLNERTSFWWVKPVGSLCRVNPESALVALFKTSTKCALFWTYMEGYMDTIFACCCGWDLLEPAVKPDSTTANRKAEHLCWKTNIENDETDVSVTRLPGQQWTMHEGMCVCAPARTNILSDFWYVFVYGSWSLKVSGGIESIKNTSSSQISGHFLISKTLSRPVELYCVVTFTLNCCNCYSLCQWESCVYRAHKHQPVPGTNTTYSH